MINFSRVPLKVFAKYFPKTLYENVISASLIKNNILKEGVDLRHKVQNMLFTIHIT